MKVGIVGSRAWRDYRVFCDHLKKYRALFPFDMIISGGAAGVDSMAYQYAVANGITFVCHPPKPEDGFPRAFFRRNLRIVASSEVVIAFPTIHSVGTKHTIDLCIKLKKPFYVIMVK